MARGSSKRGRLAKGPSAVDGNLILEGPPGLTQAMLPQLAYGGLQGCSRGSLREEAEKEEEQGWRKAQKIPQGGALGKPRGGEWQE